MSFWRSQLFYHPDTVTHRPLVASSACLLGEAVRYDGGHKLQAGIECWLAPYLQLQAVCPEVGIGLSVPRPTLKLVRREQLIRVVGEHDRQIDVTDSLTRYADEHLHQIGPFWPVCAWIFKARSPSCGLGSAVIDPGSTSEGQGSGAFAARMANAAPWLPLFQEDDLETNEQCSELLLFSFLASDILWQAGGDVRGLKAHYTSLLDLPLRHFKAADRYGLWGELRGELRGKDNEKRRGLIEQYRAV